MSPRSSGVEGVPEPFGLLAGQPGIRLLHHWRSVISASMDWPLG